MSTDPFKVEEGKIRLRIWGHGTPRQWHDCTEGFAHRLVEYSRKSKADIQIEFWMKGIQR